MLNYITSPSFFQISVVSNGLTFNTADSPKPGVGEVALLGLGLSLGLLRGGIGGVADIRARIQPVVRANGDSHQAEGGESPHCG